MAWATRHLYEQTCDERLGDRVVVRDPAKRAVDIHPVDLTKADLTFVSGTIGSRTVRCLSAEQQVLAHQGFRNRMLRERYNQRSNAKIARRALEIESRSTD